MLKEFILTLLAHAVVELCRVLARRQRKRNQGR